VLLNFRALDITKFSLLAILMDAVNVQRLTITELIRLLILILFELAQRFRVTIPDPPTVESVHPPHCHHNCNFCDHLCARADRHRTHRCTLHWR